MLSQIRRDPNLQIVYETCLPWECCSVVRTVSSTQGQTSRVASLSPVANWIQLWSDSIQGDRTAAALLAIVFLCGYYYFIYKIYFKKFNGITIWLVNIKGRDSRYRKF